MRCRDRQRIDGAESPFGQFSKRHGLAALRIGWGYASAPVIDALNRIRLPFNASTSAQAAAIAALGDEAYVMKSLSLARDGRTRLAQILEGAGFLPLPSATNFVTAHALDGLKEAQALEQELTKQGIPVRGLVNYSMPKALRVSIGTETVLDTLARALRTRGA